MAATPETLAHNVRAAAKDLNEAMQAAAKGGLKVSVEQTARYDHGAVSAPVVHTHVYRPV